MNIVFLTHNKQRKIVDSLMKKTPHTVLGYEPVIRGTTVTRILEHHVPHCVVICDDVAEKEGVTKADVITLLHARRPALRIIVITKDQSLGNLSFLKENAVNDVLETLDELPEILDDPMSASVIEDRIAAIIAAQEAAAEAEHEQEIAEAQTEHIPVDLSFPAVSAISFDMDSVQRIEEPEPKIIEKLTIGIAQLQHHNGCTHTAFELAALLKEKKVPVCIVLADNQTFHNLAVFHKLDPETSKEGLKVSGVIVYPFEKLETAKQNYDCTICDFSFLREEHRKAYEAMNEKIMLCSAAEWDIATTMNFINYVDDISVRKITYYFPRVSRKKFIGINKQLLKAGCIAYRLHTSPDWISPCAENIGVYYQLIGKHRLNNVKPEKSRRLFRK